MTVGEAGVNEVDTATFSTRSRLTPSSIVVKMTGNADSAVLNGFKAFVDEVSEAAFRLRVREAVFDLEELYFINSSCLAFLLRMVKRVLERPSEKYIIRFRSNPNQRWQAKSLNPIRVYAPEIVVIE